MGNTFPFPGEAWMPWKECSVMDERLRFVAWLLDGEAMSEVCRAFGISGRSRQNKTPANLSAGRSVYIAIIRVHDELCQLIMWRMHQLSCGDSIDLRNTLKFDSLPPGSIITTLWQGKSTSIHRPAGGPPLP